MTCSKSQIACVFFKFMLVFDGEEKTFYFTVPFLCFWFCLKFEYYRDIQVVPALYNTYFLSRQSHPMLTACCQGPENTWRRTGTISSLCWRTFYTGKDLSCLVLDRCVWISVVDPDPSVLGLPDPDTSCIKQKATVRKTLISTVLWLLHDFFILLRLT